MDAGYLRTDNFINFICKYLLMRESTSLQSCGVVIRLMIADKIRQVLSFNIVEIHIY